MPVQSKHRHDIDDTNNLNVKFFEVTYGPHGTFDLHNSRNTTTAVDASCRPDRASTSCTGYPHCSRPGVVVRWPPRWLPCIRRARPPILPRAYSWTQRIAPTRATREHSACGNASIGRTTRPGTQRARETLSIFEKAPGVLRGIAWGGVPPWITNRQKDSIRGKGTRKEGSRMPFEDGIVLGGRRR